MLYALIIITIVLAAILLLRLRVRFEIEDRSRRLLFAGLGRSGIDLDFVQKQGMFRIAGIPLGKFKLKRRPAKPEDAEKVARKKAKKKAKKAEKAAKPSRRTRSVSDMVRLSPAVLAAIGSYLVGLVRDAIIEEADGRIEAGFDQPDLTGMSYGYYQAAAAAVPAIGQRLQFAPVWDGRSFGGAATLAVAIPMYRLVWRTILLAKDLPLRKLIKLAIGKKRGVQDGQ